MNQDVIDSYLGIIYSIIAPLILPICVIAFMLLLLAFRYNLLHVYKSTSALGGVLFPSAWNQMFTGIYTLELCAIGLFLVVRTQDNSFGCIGQAVIAIVITILTVIFQVLLTQVIQPVKRYEALTVGNNAEKNIDVQ